jgi:hypothetical protein
VAVVEAAVVAAVVAAIQELAVSSPQLQTTKRIEIDVKTPRLPPNYRRLRLV